MAIGKESIESNWAQFINTLNIAGSGKSSSKPDVIQSQQVFGYLMAMYHDADTIS